MIRAASAIGLGILLATSPTLAASADPVVETQLPADGVTAIERVDATHLRLTFTGVPTEVKIMTSGWAGRAEQCGVNAHANYGIPLCELVTTVEVPASTPACVYLQVDGIPGENSSDPYVCRTVPTSTPTGSPDPQPTESAGPSPVPTSTTPAECTDLPPDCQLPTLPVIGDALLADTGSDVVYWAFGAIALFLVAILAMQWPAFHRYVQWLRAEKRAARKALDARDGVHS